MDEKLYGYYCKTHGYLDKFIVTAPKETYLCSKCIAHLLHITNTNADDITIDMKELVLKVKEVSDG